MTDKASVPTARVVNNNNDYSNKKDDQKNDITITVKMTMQSIHVGHKIYPKVQHIENADTTEALQLMMNFVLPLQMTICWKCVVFSRQWHMHRQG